MYQYIFGPVPSRRLGLSLGVDLVPHKTCTLDCIYCECGATTNLTLDRSEYVPFEGLIRELTHYFEHNPDPDYITFSGAGEPCLNTRMGDLINFIKEKRPGVSVAVLTNGTLLSQPEVRKALLGADLVIPSLDAVLAHAFRTINRPCRGIDLAAYIRGVAEFRREFGGDLDLEVLILPGINDSDADLAALKSAVDDIRPRKVQLNTLDRPGTRSNIEPASRALLENIKSFLEPHPVEIIASAPERAMEASRHDLKEVIMETVSRRPCTIEDLSKITGREPDLVLKALTFLEKSRQVRRIEEKRGAFYKAVNLTSQEEPGES